MAYNAIAVGGESFLRTGLLFLRVEEAAGTV